MKNKLIELGLTPEQAETVHRDMTMYCMLEEKPKQKHDNRKSVSAIKKAVPKQTFDNGNELNSETLKVVDIKPQISEIIFVISGGKETYRIDDPYLIEKIRQSVYSNVDTTETSFVSVTGEWGKKRNRGNQPKPLLKTYAKQYMEYFSGSEYKKRQSVGKIFALYLEKYKGKDEIELQHNIASLLS